MPKTNLLAPSWQEKALAPSNWQELKQKRWQQRQTFKVTGFTHLRGFDAVNAAINWEPDLGDIEPNVEESAFLFDSMRTFSYAAFWVMKRQAKVLSPTLKKILDNEYPAFMASQRRGLFQNSLYELAFGVFDHFGIETGAELMMPYESWPDWWLACFLELANSHAVTGLQAGDQLPERQEFADYLDEAYASLKKFEIPDGLHPHMTSLLGAAISIAKPNKSGAKTLQESRISFREFYWEPMLIALRNYKVYIKGLNRNTGKIKPVWQRRDPKTKHFYSNLGGRRKKFSYRKIIESI